MIGRRRRRVRHGPGPLAGPAIGPVGDAGDGADTPPPSRPEDAPPGIDPEPTTAEDRAADALAASGAERASDPERVRRGDETASEAQAPAEIETAAEQVWDSEGGAPGAGAEPSNEQAAARVAAGEPDAVVRPSWWARVFDLRRARNAVAMLGLALMAFVTGLIVFNSVVMPRLVHSVNEQRIPDLTNLTVDQAEKNLSARGLALSRAGERFDPSVPRGFILSQDPPAETPIRGKKRVTVVVSLGEEFSSVPELFGESVRTAQYLLERAGLRLGGVTRAPSEEVGEGLVASTDPPAESVLPRDAPVSLLVSTGGGEERFVMPDVLGREIGGARRQLEAFGFRVSTPPAAPSVGTIVFQDPAPGASITRSTPIVLQATGRIIR